MTLPAFLRPPRSGAPGAFHHAGSDLLAGAVLGLVCLMSTAPPSAAQTPDPQSAPVAWEACTLEGRTGSRAGECARVEVPLDHDDPAGATMHVAVTRIQPEGPVRRQLWFLDGGPGDAGRASLARVAEALPDARGVALYTLDHRGVGGSALLECPREQAADSAEGREVAGEEWTACAAWLESNRPDLFHLSTDASARDLATLVERLREPGVGVVVMGASYGTYWANRYLYRHGDQPDAVILDGIAPPDWSFAEFDQALDRMGRRLLDLCTEDAECGARLGGDAPVFVADVARRLGEGHCQDLGMDPELYRLVLGNLLMGGRRYWPYIAVLSHRLDRCAVRDILAIAHFFEAVFESGAVSEPASHSQVLQRHVAMSELWPPSAPGPEHFQQAAARTLMTTGVSSSFARTAGSWPVYPHPPGWGQAAAFDGPVLMLHGGLDPTVGAERLDGLRAHFSGPGQRFVFFPLAGHVVLGESACASALYTAFLEDPGEELDTRCAGEGEPVSFAAPDPSLILGTEDVWGDTPWELLVVGGAGLLLMLSVGWALRAWRRRRADPAGPRA